MGTSRKEGLEMPEVKEILDTAKDRMDKARENLERNFAGVRTGRANAMILDRVKVDYYGTPTPVNQMAAIKTPEAQLLVIEPWDKSVIKDIERAINESDLGVTPNSDGTVIRLPFPALTEERRRELAKQCRSMAEEARVSIRNARRDANNAVSRMQKDDGLPEDEVRRVESQTQKLTDESIAKVDEMLKRKEEDIMEV